MLNIKFNNTNYPFKKPLSEDSNIFGKNDVNFLPVFSGKSALSILLNYYREQGILENKSAEILVPPWMGYWVYMIMHKNCFPTTTFNSKVRGVLIYHQWGFPQRMQEVMEFARRKNLFTIEDCAHSFESYYGNQRLGTIGDAAIFSLAKFFPCNVAGGIYTSDKNIQSYVKHKMYLGDRTNERKAREDRMKYDKKPSERNQLQLERSYATYDKLYQCDSRALHIVAGELKKGAIQRRNQNAEILKEVFFKKDTFGLFSEKVSPWIMPLFISTNKARKISGALSSRGVESEVMRFDVNRNMLNPDYRECLAVPCHDGVSEKEIDTIINIIHEYD